MLSQEFMVEFLEKCRSLRRQGPLTGGTSNFFEVLDRIRNASLHDDEEENKVEIAKVIIDILEPERVGSLVMGKEPGKWPKGDESKT